MTPPVSDFGNNDGLAGMTAAAVVVASPFFGLGGGVRLGAGPTSGTSSNGLADFEGVEGAGRVAGEVVMEDFFGDELVVEVEDSAACASGAFFSDLTTDAPRVSSSSTGWAREGEAQGTRMTKMEDQKLVFFFDEGDLAALFARALSFSLLLRG
jgi:hypothetical protein